MIGGITYGEIATIRYIEKKLQQKGINKKFVILTDGIVNGSKIIEAAIPQDITDCWKKKKDKKEECAEDKSFAFEAS